MVFGTTFSAMGVPEVHISYSCVESEFELAAVRHVSVSFNPICIGGGGKFAPLLSYFDIAPKLNKTFALMHPDFEPNLITHSFRNFGVSRTTGSDVIFAFVRSTEGVLCSFEHNACLSVGVFYSLYCVFIIDANL